MMFASDGDSFVLNVNGQRTPVRLLGIDAPELGQSCSDAQGTLWECGMEARRALTAMAPRGSRLQCSVQGMDSFARALAQCNLGAERDLAGALVVQGWAVASGEDYQVKEAEARARRIGIWRGSFDAPADWRAAHPRANTAIRPPS